MDKRAFPLLLCAAAHGATLPSLVQTRFKLHAGPAQQRVQKESVSVLASNWRALAQAAPRAEVEEGVSMPLVSIEPSNQTLQIHPAALQALARAPAPVCVLGVTGTARDGKSTWLNMYGRWLRERWATNAKSATAQGDFEVGHDLDTCTTGGWLQLFTGTDAEPVLPGTHCSTVALLDTQGLAKGHQHGLHRLFTLSLLTSSSIVLNVMRQFNDDALERLGAATAHARRALPNNPFGGDTPNLVVLLRDARLRQQHEGRAVRPDTMLESALQRVGDPLDATRDAIREFFNNRTMTAMKQPDEYDLSTMMAGGLPARGSVFWQSFEASAQRTTELLRPKAVGGVPLSGDLLAAVVQSLTHHINENEPLSMAGAVGGLLQEQAEEAVDAARRTFRKLAPASRGGAAMRAAVTAPPASLDLLIRNATQAALAEFAARAPIEHASSGWLQPYFEQLRTSLTASHRELRQAQAHAARLAAVSAAERRLRAERGEQQREVHRLQTLQQTAGRRRMQELLIGNVAVLGLAACATLGPPVLFARLAPLVRTAPLGLAGLGVWRLAQKWGDLLLARVEPGLSRIGHSLKAASWVGAGA